VSLVVWNAGDDRPVRGNTFGLKQGSGYALVDQTGTMAAALAQNALVWGIRALPSSSPQVGPIEIDSLWMAFTTIVAFTTAVTAGRALAVHKATATAPITVGGAATVAPCAKWTGDAGANNGLDGNAGRIATTAALTAPAGYALGARVALLDLTAFGAAGARTEGFWAFEQQQGVLALDPGELLVIVPPVKRWTPRARGSSRSASTTAGATTSFDRAVRCGNIPRPAQHAALTHRHRPDGGNERRYLSIASPAELPWWPSGRRDHLLTMDRMVTCLMRPGATGTLVHAVGHVIDDGLPSATTRNRLSSTPPMSGVPVCELPAIATNCPAPCASRGFARPEHAAHRSRA
jgi:hypothetical protein